MKIVFLNKIEKKIVYMANIGDTKALIFNET